MAIREAYKSAFGGWWNRVLDDARGNVQYLRLQPLKEGLAISLLRMVWLPFVLYHLVIFEFLVGTVGFLLLVFFGWQRWDKSRLRGLFYFLVDLYVATWTGVIAYAYSLCYGEIASWGRGVPGHYSQPILLAGLISLLRLYEIWAFIGCLHSQRKYELHSKVRAILNTVWHYGEVIVCFATIYLCVSYLWSDTFSSSANTPIDKQAIAKDWVTPLYFSTTTIVTLGFGDLSPQTLEGRIVVVAQILFGIFLFVVVLQRAMSGEEADQVDESPSRTHVSL
jgi:hypothetical protein